MKNLLILCFSCLSALPAISANHYRPTVLKETLNSVQSLEDLTPAFWRELVLENKDRFELDLRRKNDSALGYYIYPQENNYKNILTVVGVEVSAPRNRLPLTAWSSSDRLTSEQKKLIYETALGEEVIVKVRFHYNNYGAGGAIVEGVLPLTVVPDREAQYPRGDLGTLVNDLAEYVNLKSSGKRTADQSFQATVKFTVAEDGRISAPQIITSSKVSSTDRLLLEALRQLPAWKPAENKNGLKVKQSFKIAFGGC